MTLSNFSKAVLVTLAAGLFAIPSVVVAQPGWNQELVNRPYWPATTVPGPTTIAR